MTADDVPIGTWLFGFDITDPELQERVYLANRDATREWSQHTTEPFLLWGWAAKKVLLPANDDRGETVAVRIVLIDDAGDTMSFTSRGACESLDLIRAMEGDGPYKPAIPVTIAHKSLDGGRQWLEIRKVLSASKKKK